MTEQEKFLKDVDKYEAASLRLFPGMIVIVLAKFSIWCNEIRAGHAECGDLRGWITSLIAYYGEKDHSYTEYLEGLLK